MRKFSFASVRRILFINPGFVRRREGFGDCFRKVERPPCSTSSASHSSVR
jgi:hypothetical protein